MSSLCLRFASLRSFITERFLRSLLLSLFFNFNLLCDFLISRGTSVERIFLGLERSMVVLVDAAAIYQ